MKARWMLLSAIFATAWAFEGHSVAVVFDQQGVAFTARQPIQAVVVDGNGNSTQQTVYYDPSFGGVDLDTSWAGQNASVYFPTLNTGYVWYNGYWVNPSGYYWNGGNRYYVGPQWNNYWSGYWKGRGYWDGNWNRNGWHDGGWHGDYWHGGGGDWHGGDWHGGGGEWHGGGGDWHGGGDRGGDFRGGDFRGGDRGGDFRGGGDRGGGHRR